MRAVVYDSFGGPLEVRAVEEPTVPADGVLLAVGACGICRSDWHGWQGHDSMVTLPHVLGHELAGEIIEVGPDVERWRIGDRVTVPFVGGCGRCRDCAEGHPQVCANQVQPGFSHWGAYAERVALFHADVNLVRLPDSMDYVAAAGLGCRFATAFRAVVDRGRVAPEEFVVVFGCGGVGLSAIQIAAAEGARVVAVDVEPTALERAVREGAIVAIDATATDDVVEAVRDVTDGGAHLAVDAIGGAATCIDGIRALRRRGRHVQVGLLVGDEAAPNVPMDIVVAWELEVLGSHGMAAAGYERMFRLIAEGRLDPGRLVERRVSLDEAPGILAGMDRFDGGGVAIIDRFA